MPGGTPHSNSHKFVNRSVKTRALAKRKQFCTVAHSVVSAFISLIELRIRCKVCMDTVHMDSRCRCKVGMSPAAAHKPYHCYFLLQTMAWCWALRGWQAMLQCKIHSSPAFLAS